MPPAPTLVKGRDGVLDFWRGASIAMVLFQHLTYYRFRIFRQFVETAGYTGSLLHNALLLCDHAVVAFAYRSGDWGVKFFFVISGYIITKLLLDEEARTGAISVWKFYFRRICRIVPAYGLYLIFLCAFGLLGWTMLDLSQVPRAALLLCNTSLATCGWDIGHTWTLAIEEQFYILWPLFLVLLPRRWRIPGTVFLFGMLFAFSVSGFLVADTWIDNALSFICILMGGLYAMSEGFRAYIQKYGLATAAAALVAIVILDKVPGMSANAHLIFREATPFFILVCIFLSYRLVRFQRTKLFFWTTQLGLISYSLYIWQEVFTNYPSGYPEPSLLIVTPLMFVFAIASYFYIEKPAIKWGKDFLHRESPRAPVLEMGPGI